METRIAVVALSLLISGWNIPDTRAKPAVVTMSAINLFNTGVNAGWLATAMNRSKFTSSWGKWAEDAALEFNEAYSHPPVTPPEINQFPDVDFWFQKIQMAVRDMGSSTDACDRLAFRLLNAGFCVGRVDIDTRIGECSDCVRYDMQLAAIELKAISPCVPAGKTEGDTLEATARSIGPSESPARFSSFVDTITSARMAIQSALGGLPKPDTTAPASLPVPDPTAPASRRPLAPGPSNNCSGTYVIRLKSHSCEGDFSWLTAGIDLVVTANGNQLIIDDPSQRNQHYAQGTIRADGTFEARVAKADPGTEIIHGRCANGILEFTGVWRAGCTVTFAGGRK